MHHHQIHIKSKRKGNMAGREGGEKERGKCKIYLCIFIFLQLYFNYMSLLPFLSSNLLLYPSFLFSLITIACTYIFVYTYIPKYTLLSPYDVACMCALRVAYLALDNQLECSSLGNTTSPTPSQLSSLPIVLLWG